MTGAILDHAAQSRKLIVSQFQQSPRLLATLAALMVPVQQLEFELFRLLYLRSLAFSDGAQLDALGDLRTLPRAGKTDAAYRDAMRAAVLRNTCNGTPDELIRYVRSLNGNLPVQYAETGTAGFALENRGASVPGLARLVRDVAPAGVGPIVVSQAPEGPVTV